MRALIIFLLILTSAIAEEALKPGDKLPTLRTTIGKTYEQVTVREITPGSLKIVHSAGISTVWIKDLEANMQQRCNYSAESGEADRLRALEKMRDDQRAVAAMENAARQNEASIRSNAAATTTSTTSTSSTADLSVGASKISQDIMAFAVKEWPKDYEMQKYVCDRIYKGLHDFVTMRKEGWPGVPADILNGIAHEAREKWYPQFDMVAYTAKQQCEAYVKLNH